MKRYRPTEDGMAVSETGMWVRHTDAAELQRQLGIAKEALAYIASYYPETDEGETMAAHAKGALEEILK